MTEMVDMERLARVWRKMQDKRDEIRAAYEAADKSVEDQQKIVGTALLSAMTGMKGDKLTTASGVIERQTKTQVSGADWNAIYRFVTDHDAWQMLHKRLSSTFVDAWAKDHDGELPPGVNVFRTLQVVVKKPGSKSVPHDE